MSRPIGTKNPDYDEKRAALADGVMRALFADANVSLRGMAQACGVSRPTLVHYFGDREGAVCAALEYAADFGRGHVEGLASAPLSSARLTLRTALLKLLVGWRDFGVGNFHYVGFQVGLADGATGAAYRHHIFDPVVVGVSRLLQRLIDAGRLRQLDTRSAALQLLGPLVMALMHQHGLCGHEDTPLALEPFVDDIVHTFVLAHALDEA
ncbi:MAG: TetR/AcrR family transcriptional regulator [Deltaproteobacteria bacterium]|nr:MAG: TetR/AcrR family transcriptional regulator [Deltaproteobacteria bacterium]